MECYTGAGWVHEIETGLRRCCVAVGWNDVGPRSNFRGRRLPTSKHLQRSLGHERGCWNKQQLMMLSGGISVDTNFLKAHAERCRLLAENADPFTKRRLLDLAAHYDRRIRAAEPSVATRFLKSPLSTKDTSTQI
jgi:hypothetical protein